MFLATPRAKTGPWRLFLILICCGISSSHLTVLAANQETPATTPAHQLAQSTAKTKDPMGVEIHTLANGLTVYLSPHHQQPRVYAEIIVRAGSKHDPSTNTGLAHYLEHLLFKGTQHYGTTDYQQEAPLLAQISELYEAHFAETDADKRAALYKQIDELSTQAAAFAIPNEFDNLYKGLGANRINAHTSTEETVYKVSIPSNRLEQWATIERERFANPVFRLFHTELEVVYEEKNRALDNPHRLIRETILDALFPQHPYGQQSTLGDAEHLRSPSIKTIEAYYRKHYVPGNMAICLSGSFDSAEALAIITKHFSSWPAQAVPEQPSWEDQGPQGRQAVSITYPGEESIQLAFRTVPNKHSDAPALKLFDMVLDNRTAGLLNLNLTQAQRVRHAGAFPSFQNDAGAQYLYATPKPGQSLTELEALLLEQIALVQAGDFDQDLLPAIILDYRKQFERDLESDIKRVAHMRRAFLSFRSWDEYIAEVDAMAALTKADVVRVANTYFGENYVVGMRHDGEHQAQSIAKPPITPVSIDPSKRSDFAKQVAAMDSKTIIPNYLNEGDEYVKQELGRDQYTFVPNPTNSLFDLRIRIPVGSRHQQALSILSLLIKKAASSERSNAELQQAWYAIGAEPSIRIHANAIEFTLSGMDEQLSSSLALWVEQLFNATAEQSTLDQIIANVIHKRSEQLKDHKVLSRALDHWIRYGDSSDYIHVLSNEALQQLQVADVLALVHDLNRYPKHISYTGTKDAKTVIAALQAAWPSAEEALPAPKPRLQVAREATAHEVYLVHQATAQSLLRIVFPGNTYAEAQRPLIDSYNNYFAGGMSGIVFQELRESRALAYVAYGNYTTPNHAEEKNLFFGYIGCQSDKTLDALDAFVAIIDDLPLSQERFASSQQGLQAAFSTNNVNFRAIAGTVQAWAELGLNEDPRPRRKEQAAALSLEQLSTFHQALIADKPKFISIVGNTEAIDQAKLQAYGPIKTIDPAQVFGF